MNQIPKTIHYCWFGNNPLPALERKCIESWREHCPDYEIIEWNERNFDVNCCSYVKEAYEQQKWAFVSDYARFKILYEQGGVYFDTDVELIRDIDDILEKGAFMGLERPVEDDILAVAPGLGLAAPAGHFFFKEVLEEYSKRNFTREDGRCNQLTVVRFVTDLLVKYGLENSNCIQKAADIYIYPNDYFCPKDYATGIVNCTENTRAIHHFSASWFSKRELNWYKLEQKIGILFGKKFRAWLKGRYFWRVPAYLYKNGFINTLKRSWNGPSNRCF